MTDIDRAIALSVYEATPWLGIRTNTYGVVFALWRYLRVRNLAGMYGLRSDLEL